MTRRLLAVTTTVVMLAASQWGTSLAAEPPSTFTPGAPGVGDPYYPLAGNGGYDVRHYFLDVDYDPTTDMLTGTAVIFARATQDLSAFNLDLEGLTVEWVRVNGRPAASAQDDGELTITPKRGLREGRPFVARIRYGGVPEPVMDSFGTSGFLHTDDGALIVGQPRVAATWYPVNDHPSDKASYTLRYTVPEGLEVVSNGVLAHHRTRGGDTTWTWVAREPMASYLVGASIGELDVREYAVDGIKYWDAIDPALFTSPAPRSGEQFAIAPSEELTYQRLTRTISVPEGGADLSFWVHRDTEPEFDFFFVEARTAGADDWTTLPDTNGHASQATGFACPFWLQLHPFLTHYQSDTGDGSCAPEGTTGSWWAASGASDGYEQWAVDLDAYAGGSVEVSLTVATDGSLTLPGVVVDDIEVTVGDGSTSFEDDGDPWDGWAPTGPPASSPPAHQHWVVGTVQDTPPPLGKTAEQAFELQPDIIEFLASYFGPYPFGAAGGIVDDAEIFFALENQTRPIYSYVFFADPVAGEQVVVHELAHMWYGDSVTLAEWQHIWLHEGFAVYAEWLWSGHRGRETPQELYDNFTSVIPADAPFWSLTIGDPGPDDLFAGPVYLRGAMTLHALRLEVGDDAFFQILRRWAQAQAGGNVTTSQFIALAERVSGQQLDELFETWLYTPTKPDGLPTPDAADASINLEAAAVGTTPAAKAHVPAAR